MSKKVLLLQYRDDVSKDQEIDCIKKSLNISDDELKVANILLEDFDDVPVELLKDVRLVIIGPSGQYDLSKKPKPIMRALEKSKNTLNYLIENDFPTLAICFGAQLLAQRLGAEVRPVEEMSEAGTFEITINEAGQSDKFFGNVKPKFMAVIGHKESILNIPEGTTLLASSEKCPVQAFKYKQNIYATQFHPELDKEALLYRLKLYPEYLKETTLEEIADSFAEVTEPAKLFRQFLL